jgi:hypothetical protein
VSAESDIGLKIYDGCYKAIATSVAKMDQRGRDLFLEHHLAAVVAVTRQFCPARADGFFRAACLDVRAKPRKPEFSRWRLYAFVASLSWPWLAAFAFAVAFWLVAAVAALSGRPL